MKYNWFFLESLMLLIVVTCLLLCSCKTLPIISDSEYDRYLRERERDQRERDFQERIPHLPIPRR